MNKETTTYTDQFAEYLNRLSTDYGFPYVDLYVKDNEVLGVLISKSEELVDQFMKIEVQSLQGKAIE